MPSVWIARGDFLTSADARPDATLPDLLKQARIVNSNTFQTTESFFWAAVGYMLLTVTVTVLVRSLESRYAVRR